MENFSIDRETATESRANFLIDRAEFAKALAFMAKHFIQPRNTLPILSSVLIEAGPESVRLVATDLDMMAEMTLPANVSAPGRFTIAAASLAENLKKADGERVMIIDGGEGRARVHSGRAAFNVPTLPADDFPMIAPPSGGKHFTLPAEWARDMSAVAPCISKEERRYYLNGIAMQCRNARAFMVTADGPNMAVIDRPAPAGMEGMSDAIIHRGTVSAMLAWVKATKAAGPLVMDMGISRFRAELPGGLLVTSKLIDGTFPNWFNMIYGREVGPESCPVPALDPRLPMPAIERMAKAAGAALAVDNFDNCALLTCADRPEFMGLVMHLKDAAAQGTPETLAMVNGRAVAVGKPGGVTLTKEQVAAMCNLDALFQTVPVAMPDGSTAHVLQWIMDAGYSKLWTVRPDGRTFGDKDRHLRQTLTREYVLAMARGGYEPVASLESFEMPEETFAREYRQAWQARDGAAMRAAVAKLRAAGCAGAVMALAARIRGIEGETVRKVYASRSPGCVAYHLRKQRAYSEGIAAKRDWLDSKAFHPADPRWLVPIERGSGKGRAYVRASDLRNVETFAAELLNSNCQQLERYPVKIYCTDLQILPGKNADERAQIAAAIEAWESERTPSAAQEPVTEAPAPVVAESEAENLPTQTQEAIEAPTAPPAPQITSSGPEIGQDGAGIAAASTEIAFSAWLTAQFGPWIIAGRQSAKMTEAGKRALTPRHYAKLKARWERGERADIEAAPPAPPLVEKPAHDVAALVDLVQALAARIEALEGARLDQVTPALDQVSPKRTRTPAHERAIRAYLALRKERVRHAQTDDKRQLYAEMANTALFDLGQAKAKRRRAVIKARALQTQLYAEHRLVDRYADKRREAERALVEAHTQAEILGKSLREASERALKAETALAAVEARANGWPPAVRPASVTVRYAA